MARIAETRFGGWVAIHIANPIDRRLLPLTGGRIGFPSPRPAGLLETVGAKSGQPRRTPLLFLEDGDRVVLVASKAGDPRHPAWYHNLKANPRVRFMRRDRGQADFVAREATGPEREELWAKVNDLYAGYEAYQGRASGRKIPVIVLDPAADDG